MARSQKTQVIEYLFNKHWNETRGALDKTLMSLDDVAEAIRECNKLYGLTLSDRNLTCSPEESSI